MALFGRGKGQSRGQNGQNMAWMGTYAPHGADSVARAEQAGMDAMMRQDPHEMVRAGLTLLDVAGGASELGWNLVYDGYRGGWEEAAATATKMEFLRSLLSRFSTITPQVLPGADLVALPQPVAQAAAREYAHRCFAATELHRVAAGAGQLTPELEATIYQALNSTHEQFIPPRSQGLLNDLRASGRF